MCEVHSQIRVQVQIMRPMESKGDKLDMHAYFYLNIPDNTYVQYCIFYSILFKKKYQYFTGSIHVLQVVYCDRITKISIDIV